MSNEPKRKYHDGQLVEMKKYLHVKNSVWNGTTFVYSFYEDENLFLSERKITSTKTSKRQPLPTPLPVLEIDAELKTEKQIIEELLIENPNVSYSEIAKTLGVHLITATKRVKSYGLDKFKARVRKQPIKQITLINQTNSGPVLSLEELEKKTIQESLHRHAGNRRKVSEELKIVERTLYRKLQQYGLMEYH